MAETDTKELLKTIMQAQIIAALNSSPDVIEKLVKSALELPVDSVTGTRDGYHGNKVPYVDYLVGEEIRSAARDAARKLIRETVTAETIEAKVRQGLSTDTIVQAVTEAFVTAAAQDWKIEVTFAGEKRG